MSADTSLQASISPNILNLQYRLPEGLGRR